MIVHTRWHIWYWQIPTINCISLWQSAMLNNNNYESNGRQWRVTCLCWAREHLKDREITFQEVCFMSQGHRAPNTVLLRLFPPIMYCPKPTHQCRRSSVTGFLCQHTQVTWSCNVHASYACHCQRSTVSLHHTTLCDKYLCGQFFDGSGRQPHKMPNFNWKN